MSLLPVELDQIPRVSDPTLPAVEHRFAPETAEQASSILTAATDRRLPVLLWGAGTHQGWGHPVEAPIVISTRNLNRLIAWEPDDLTVVVEAGMPVSELEERLSQKNLTAALPETGDGTVGGVVAAGLSGYRRARYGPTRDRMLEVTLVTGDGREVRGGGRVVKNVTGFDIPRLVTGSFGSLGLIVSVCFKLWPLPERAVTLTVEDAAEGWRRAYRPLAVLETETGARVYLQGSGGEVEGQIRRIGGEPSPGLDWPAPPRGPLGFSLRVPPDRVGEAVTRLDGWSFVAQHGVGEVAVAGDREAGEVEELRAWAESLGGSLAMTVESTIDPWGRPPAAVELHRRLMAAFDPAHILNPERLGI